MLSIGDKFPNFSATSVVSMGDTLAFKPVTNGSESGKWKVFFFYPKDFTFICPTEITGFESIYSEFTGRNTEIYGASTDSEYVHKAWREHNPDLNKLSFPLISDITRDLSESLGIINQSEGVCYRATFIVDPEQTIRYVSVNDLSVGRSPAEILRVLDGLQNGGLTPCNWKKGDQTLSDATQKVA